MILYGDYHTHTTYSHGKNSVLENVKVAAQKGLKEIAITDHGFNHKYFALKRANVDLLRKEALLAEEKYKIKVLYGVETNFISLNGKLDIGSDDYEQMDILLAGFHQLVKMDSCKDFWQLRAKNIIYGDNISKESIDKNTAVILRSLEKYKIDILTHLNYGMKVNTLEVAKAARDCGTFIELNGKRILFTEEEIDQMVKEKVVFIVNSDAHKAIKVGENITAENLIFAHNIPLDLIANANKLPIFHKKRG